MKKKNLNVTPLIIIAIIFLSNPNINIVDPLPDFIGCFLLAFSIGKSAYIIPYMQEAKSALLKLGLIGIIKIPAMLIMFANLGTGRDIIPLFTLVFAACESIVIVSAVTHGFRGIFYLGERCTSDVILTPINAFGKRIRPETVRNLTYAFLLSKVTVCVLPELCLLTFSSREVANFLAVCYPFCLIAAFLAVLVFAVFFANISIKYTRAIAKDKSVITDLYMMADAARLDIIDKKREVRIIVDSLTVLSISTLLSIEIAFDNTNGINILPHFIFGLTLLFVALRMYSDRKCKIFCSVLAALYSVFGIAAHLFTINFLDKYEYLDLLTFNAAKKAYLPIEIFSVLEAVSFALFAIFLLRGFLTFIREHTGLSPESERYGRCEIEYHRGMSIRACVFFALMLVISIFKCINVFLKANVKTIFTDTGMVVTGAMPWADSAILILCILLIGYGFYYISDVKADVKMKYADLETRLTDERLN